VPEDFRVMRVQMESRRISVPADPVADPVLRHMRVIPDNRRIIVPPERDVLLRQKHEVMPA
jgi:hypothetical protein